MKQPEEKKEENDSGTDEFEMVTRILKQGWLGKKSFLGGEDRRIFILKNDGVFFYERGEARAINLMQAKAIEKKGNFGIVITTRKTTWTLNSLTTHDRDDWINAMNSIDGVRCDECDICSQQE